MAHPMTVGEVLDRVRERRRAKRCPDCAGVVSIRGICGEYWWECLSCDSISIGFSTRSDAREAVCRNTR